MSQVEKSILKYIRNSVATASHPAVRLALMELANRIESGKHLEDEVMPARSTRKTVQITPILPGR